MNLPLNGGCLCGAVRYTISQEPLFSGHCYCRSCQQMTGGSHVSFMFMDSESIKTEGEYQENISVGSSGKNVHRCFCSKCGSTLFCKLDSLDGKMTVSASSLDHPEDFTPQANIFLSEAQSWAPVDRSIACFDQNPSQA